MDNITTARSTSSAVPAPAAFHLGDYANLLTAVELMIEREGALGWGDLANALQRQLDYEFWLARQ